MPEQDRVEATEEPGGEAAVVQAAWRARLGQVADEVKFCRVLKSLSLGEGALGIWR